MRDERGTADPLLSRAEFAALAGVTRPTITKWAERHENFPELIHLADGQYFSLTSVLEWLDGRPIPAKDRSADEPADATYGWRARHSSLSAPRVPPAQPFPHNVRRDAADFDRRLGSLAAGIRGGGGSSSDYLTLLLCLVFLRTTAPDHWIGLLDITARDPDRLRAEGLVREVSERTDRALRSYGVPSGVYSVLERLRPRNARDMVEVIRVCDELGGDGFDPLLSRFATEARLGSASYFTPAEVARLMAQLVVIGAAHGGTVYDPYLRGGELLRAASRSRRVRAVGGESPNRETLRLAGMSLAVHGRSARLRLGSDTPWDKSNEHRAPVDAVLLNPPFNRQRPTTRQPDNDWPFGPPPPHSDNYAWLQHAVSSLTSKGKAAVLMPAQAGVSSDEQEREIRRKMVEEGAVEAVIALPTQVFPLSEATVMLWVVRRPTRGPRRILFVDARGMSDGARARPVLSPDAVRLIPELYADIERRAEGERIELTDDGVATVTGIDALRDSGYSLHPSDYLEGAFGTALPMQPEKVTFSLAELAALRSHVHQADLRVEELRTFPRTSAPNGPSDWRRLMLNEICEIQAGPSYSRLGVAERTENGSVPVVMPRHLRDRRVMATDAARVTEELARKLGKFRLSTYDILCVRSGATAEPALVQEEQEGWIFGSNLFRLCRLDADLVDPWYLLGFLCLPAVRQWIDGRSTGTVIPFITKHTLGQLVVSLPPLDEQRRIGVALRAFDDQVAAHRNFARASARARETLAERLMEGTVTLP